MKPEFVLKLDEEQAAIVERALHEFCDKYLYSRIGDLSNKAYDASNLSLQLLEQAADQGVEFPEY